MAVDDVSFSISLVGDETKEKWFGKFKALKRLSFRQQMARDRVRREYLGDLAQYATARILDQASVFADLAVSLTEFPGWWKDAAMGQDLHDDNLIEAVWLEVQKIQGKFVEDAKKKTEEDAKVLKKAVENEDANKPEESDEA